MISAMTSAASDTTSISKVFDLAGCPPLTYMEMMNLTAKGMGLKRIFLSVPLFTPTLSRLWVSLITNSSKDLVYPLIESLQHPMLARESNGYLGNPEGRTYSDLLKTICLKPKSNGSLFGFRAQRKTVRSVQRLQLPDGKDAKWVKDQYLNWLPRFLAPFIVVTKNGDSILFSLFKNGICLLEMSFSNERSSEDRQLLYVLKGLLVSASNRGRLEFRVVLNRRYVLAAIHEFKPALPWFIYKYTQAKLHLFVMNAFSRHLARIALSKNSF